jgi:small subunit ribosomal protein S1
VLEIGQTVKVKVLDVDRDRQRISLGLKQTQTDPWQRVIDETHQGDVVVGRITKVVTFGAFAEILSGVEGLIHISELADHHVENPRDVVNQGDEVNVKVIEIDAERRRLSLSLKRVEAGETVKRIEMSGTTTAIAEQPVPNLGLSEEVFADVEAEPVAESSEPDESGEATPELTAEPAADADPVPEPEPEPEAAADAEPEPEAEAAADAESEPEAAAEPEPEAAAEPEPEAAADSDPEPDAEPAAEAEPEQEPADKAEEAPEE